MSPRAIGSSKLAARAAGPQWDLPLYGPMNEMTTISPPEADIWGHLLSMTALPRFRVVARGHGLTASEGNAAFPSARAFLLQAHDYYEAAKSVGERSAPLLQYYSLLNLAKFVISLSRPALLVDAADLHHGLSVVRGGRSPRTAELQTKRGIFSALAEVITGVAMPAHRVRVSDLIARCPDVSVEYRAAWNHPAATTTCLLTEVRDPASAQAWVRLTLLPGGSTFATPTWTSILRSGSHMRAAFREVAKASQTGFGLADFESIGTVPVVGRSDSQIREDLRGMVRPLCLVAHGGTYQLKNGATQRTHGIPHFIRGRPPVPEPCVILGIAFYLSHVVRYSPFLFDEWQRSTDSWLVGTFGRSGPAKFVRLALDIAVQSTHVFQSI